MHVARRVGPAPQAQQRLRPHPVSQRRSAAAAATVTAAAAAAAATAVVADAKRELLALGAASRYGAEASAAQRARALSLVEVLATAMMPATAAATAAGAPEALLGGRWALAYTTEGDVHRLAPAATAISQELDFAARRVTNRIELRLLGLAVGLAAGGPLRTPGPSPLRVAYAFDALTVTLFSRVLSLPPRGGGWSEAVYADGACRVMRNSRGDTLVLTKEAEAG
jgi:hypothetical protein